MPCLDNFQIKRNTLKGISFITTSETVAQRCSVKKGVLRHFTKFIGKHLCQSLFFNEVVGLQLYLKRDSGTGVFLWTPPVAASETSGFRRGTKSRFWKKLLVRRPANNCFWFLQPLRTLRYFDSYRANLTRHLSRT